MFTVPGTLRLQFKGRASIRALSPWRPGVRNPLVNPFTEFGESAWPSRAPCEPVSSTAGASILPPRGWALTVPFERQVAGLPVPPAERSRQEGLDGRSLST